MEELNSWYIPKNSEAFQHLIKKNLVTYEDVSKVCKNSKLSGYLRCFTIEQVELFLREVVKESGVGFAFDDIAIQERIIYVFHHATTTT